MILSGHRRRLAQLYRLEHGTTDDPRVPTIVREVVNPLEGVISLHEMDMFCRRKARSFPNTFPITIVSHLPHRFVLDSMTDLYLAIFDEIGIIHRISLSFLSRIQKKHGRPCSPVSVRSWLFMRRGSGKSIKYCSFKKYKLSAFITRSYEKIPT